MPAFSQVLPVLQERFPIQRARMRLKLQVGALAKAVAGVGLPLHASCRCRMVLVGPLLDMLALGQE